MENRYFIDDFDFVSSNDKADTFPSFSSLRVNNELFDDSENRCHMVLSVKRIILPKNGENWEIIKDGRVIFKLPGTRLNKKEKAVLRTVKGMRMLITEYKLGTKSVSKIKSKIREMIKNDKI